jgi:hypothetical protein
MSQTSSHQTLRCERRRYLEYQLVMSDERGDEGLSNGPPPTVADAIRTVEQRRLRALVDGDIETACLLHADDFQLVTPSGVLHNRESYLAAVTSGDIEYRVFEAVAEIEVRVYGEAAIIRYQSRIEMATWCANVWHTDSYELRDGRWQIVWSQATEIR